MARRLWKRDTSPAFLQLDACANQSTICKEVCYNDGCFCGRLEVTANLPSMDVLHYSTDLEDPSAGLTVAWEGFQLQMLASMNNPLHLPVEPGMSAIARKR